MFQFRRFPPYAYVFSVWCTDMTPCGFPHSDICGSMCVCHSPQLFAAYHVFLRLLVPRHSPCALLSLTVPSVSSFSGSLRIRFFCANDFHRVCSVPTIISQLSLLRNIFSSLFSFQGAIPQPLLRSWWAQVDSNHRPRAYQARALTC